jgi:hypothetical protein
LHLQLTGETPARDFCQTYLSFFLSFFSFPLARAAN